MLIIGDKDEEISLTKASSRFNQSSPKASSGRVKRQAKHVFDVVPASSAVKPESSARVMASPRAKKLAEEMGIDLAAVTGTGPAGKITEDDVKKAAHLKKRPAPAAHCRRNKTWAYIAPDKETAYYR